MPERETHILIYDTTLRDGCQAESVSLSLEDKLLIAGKLDELGVHYIEGGYPLSNPKDKEFFRRAPSLGLKSATCERCCGRRPRRTCAWWRIPSVS